MVKLPFSGPFSQSIEILLSGNCQFGSNKLIKILTGLEVSYIDSSSYIYLKSGSMISFIQSTDNARNTGGFDVPFNHVKGPEGAEV